MKRWLPLGFLIGFGFFGSCRAQDMIEVGLIESFSAPPDRYTLNRGAEQAAVPVQPGGRLMNGDQITVTSPGDRLTIWLFEPEGAKKTVVVLSQNNGVYVVDGRTRKQGLSQQLSSVWQWAASELGLRELEGKGQTTEASIRDVGAFTIPLLGNSQMLAAGRRTITLGWPHFGGAVRIAIKGPSQKVVAKSAATSNRWTSPQIDFAPGLYTIVTQASGKAIERKVEFVPVNSLPKLPNDPASAGLPPDAFDTIRAIWLSAQQQGRYALESFQIVLPISERYHPAKVFSRALIAGSLPSGPPRLD